MAFFNSTGNASVVGPAGTTVGPAGGQVGPGSDMASTSIAYAEPMPNISILRMRGVMLYTTISFDFNNLLQDEFVRGQNFIMMGRAG